MRKFQSYSKETKKWNSTKFLKILQAFENDFDEIKRKKCPQSSAPFKNVIQEECWYAQLGRKKKKKSEVVGKS